MRNGTVYVIDYNIFIKTMIQPNMLLRKKIVFRPVWAWKKYSFKILFIKF